MKRLLVVTHAFPPEPSPGALRPGYIARYLPHAGWNVTVLARNGQPPPFPAEVIYTGPQTSPLENRLRNSVSSRISDPNSPVRSALRAIKDAVMFPDTTAPWIPRALAHGSNVLRERHFDAILSTAHPPSAHVIAWMLARKFSLPWVADYRDPWAGNVYFNRGPIRGLLERLLERGMLHRADAITTISAPIAAQLQAFHRRNDVEIIPNAYDVADWDGIPDVHPSRFDLTFTGSMYSGKRDPDLLFAALAQMRAGGDTAATTARIHFYGPNAEHIMKQASRHGVNLLVREHGVVSRSTAMRAQRASAALLIFLNMDPATSSEMGSKYLEYLGARRPIIAFGPSDGVMRSFIAQHRLGWYASNIDEAKLAIRSAYERFASGGYEISADSRDLPTAPMLANRFAEVLDRVAGVPQVAPSVIAL